MVAPPEDWKQRLLEMYVQRGALAVGKFALVGGGESDFYIDGRMVTTYPPALRLIAGRFREIAEERGLLGADDTLVAPALSGVPLVVALGLELDVPYVIDRGRAKAHGMGKRFEGGFRGSERCLVVDDLVTAGTTLLDTVAALRELGRTVDAAIVTVDREEGGVERLAEQGVEVHALITQRELREAWERERV